MKQRIIYLLIALVFVFTARFAAAEDNLPSNDKLVMDPIQESLSGGFSNRVFVVETDEESAAESLNRVSGIIDLGFAAPQQTYHSKNHARQGPLEDREPT